MSANDEMRVYLEELMEHERSCGVENCGLCQSAQNVYRLTCNLIFSGVVYPGVTIAARAPVIQTQNPAADTAPLSIGHAA